MGTVATYDRTDHFFDRTLALMEPLLRQNGYCGYINLNTIVNPQGIWPLEFTCRFGYPGFAILDPLQATSWAELFRAMVARSRATIDTRPGFSVGVVLTTRPFPYIRRYVDEPIGLPILFEGDPSPEDHRHLHYGEVGREEGELVTAGYHGWTLVVTGVGPTIPAAQAQAYGLADRGGHPQCSLSARHRRPAGRGRFGACRAHGPVRRVRPLGVRLSRPSRPTP
jgi:phosphoribosylamine--glycine ligase